MNTNLQKEDYESLGWILDEKSGWFNFNYEWFKNRNYDDPHPYCLVADKKSGVIEIYDESEIDYCIFRGRLKNKSELKTLMVQVGIPA